MEINIKNIKKRKEGSIIRFSVFDELEGEKDLWTSLYVHKNHLYFNNVIYEYDKKRTEVFNEHDGFNKTRKFPAPEYYFDHENTKKLIEILSKKNEVVQHIKKQKYTLNDRKPFQIEKVKKREENLKKLIYIALKKGDYIGFIGPEAEFYVALEDIDIGQVVKDSLTECSDWMDEEEILNELKKVITDYGVKLNSYYGYEIYKNGEIKEAYPNFVWELPEECIYFDQIFYLDVVSRIGCQLIEELEKTGEIIISPKDGGIVYSEYDIVDLILYDNELVFSDLLYTLDFRDDYFEMLEKLKNDSDEEEWISYSFLYINLEIN